jgi:hypothetical protein
LFWDNWPNWHFFLGEKILCCFCLKFRIDY